MKREEKIKILKKMKAEIRGEGFGNKNSYQNTGLCHIINEIYWLEDTDEEVCKWARKQVNKLKRMKDSDYVWKPGIKAPRIKWINEQIKLLEKK